MTRYEQGFMSKCAEYGVNPQALARWAQARGMQKRAAGETRRGLVELLRAPRLSQADMEDLGRRLQAPRPFQPGMLERGPAQGTPLKMPDHVREALAGRSQALGLSQADRNTLARKYYNLALPQTGMPERVSSFPAKRGGKPLTGFGSGH